MKKYQTEFKLKVVSAFWPDTAGAKLLARTFECACTNRKRAAKAAKRFSGQLKSKAGGMRKEAAFALSENRGFVALTNSSCSGHL